ncbi:hypothetical protein FFLO_03151 [Filobasidium floriforme]|uniref:Uncharacterized protein n=1 Tax=Filobasidium floriforme TaxID=5210 RepID=A0A8K0JMN3_9TREE|nr:uncharacterized protein HD553DRAFT_307670 [Filobasidium floriforme]KAG7548946.1 hypothetical protein FFLO_03151 [Filobasidium floriforme]KAH8088236.1 hypothetical protein HD553DRAFT_307670 [Filobasidium floriforme]
MGKLDPRPGTSIPPPYSTTIGCLQLSRNDHLRLINLPPDLIQVARHTIVETWPKGIQKEGDFEGCAWEFKLKGNPWLAQGDEAIPARRLLKSLIQAFERTGWGVYTACGLSKEPGDKDTIFFHQTGVPRSRPFCSISFNKGDRLRLIDAVSPDVSRAFESVAQTWFLGTKPPSSNPFSRSSAAKDDPGCLEVKLGGTPWYASDGIEVVQARVLCCRLLEAMQSVGLELVVSVDMSTGGSGMDLCTWFLAPTLA